MTTEKQLNIKVWMDGEFVDEREAKVDFLSGSFQYGFSVFEGIRAYLTDKGPAIFRLREHIQRLYDSAKIIGLEIPYSQNEMVKACIETVRENGFDECYIRPVVYLAQGGMDLTLNKCTVSVAIATWQWQEFLGAGQEEYGARVGAGSCTRHDIYAALLSADAAL